MLHRTANRVRLIALCASVATIVLASAARGDAPRVLPEGKLPRDKRLGELKDLDGYFPFTPAENKEAWEARAEQVRAPHSRGQWPVADARAHAAQRRGARQSGSRHLHRGAHVSGELSRVLRDGQLVSAQGQEWSPARRALPARPLVQRALHRHGSERMPQAGGRGRRAVRDRGPLAVAIAVRATGANGLRRVPLRHDRVCRQPAAFVRAGASLRQAAARVRYQGELGAVQHASRAAAAEHHGTADL